MRVWDGINRYLAFRLKELEFRVQTWKRSREISRAYDTPSTRRQKASSANFYTLRLRIMAGVKLIAVVLVLFLVGFGAVKLVSLASSVMSEYAEKREANAEKAAVESAKKAAAEDKKATESAKKAAEEDKKAAEPDKIAAEAYKKAAELDKKAAEADKKAAKAAKKIAASADRKVAAAVRKAEAAERKAAKAAKKAAAAAEKKAAAASKKAAAEEKKAAEAARKAAAEADKKAAEAARKAGGKEHAAVNGRPDSGTREPSAESETETLPGLADDSGLPETAVLPEGYESSGAAPADTAAAAASAPAAPAQPAGKLVEAFQSGIPRGTSDRLILVNKAAKVMYLLKPGPDGWEVARAFPVATGENDGRKVVEGDKKTPEGVYFIVGRKHRSELTNLYGPAAFITDYPNEQDRRERRTGHGIWIHGSERGNLPPFFTQGCVATSNPEILEFASLMGRDWAGTPIVIVSGEEEAKKHLASVDFAAMKARRNEVISHYSEKQAEFEKLVNDWKAAWESRDIERYSSFYLTSSFMEGSTKWDAFRDRKNRLFNSYSAIYVDLSNIMLTEYTDNAATVKFHQVYNTNVGNKMENAKRLIFRKDQGHWKIYREIPFPKEELL